MHRFTKGTRGQENSCCYYKTINEAILILGQPPMLIEQIHTFRFATEPEEKFEKLGVNQDMFSHLQKQTRILILVHLPLNLQIQDFYEQILLFKLQARNQREGRGRFPLPFWKNTALILEKNALIIFICGLNFSFKMLI